MQQYKDNMESRTYFHYYKAASPTARGRVQSILAMNVLPIDKRDKAAPENMEMTLSDI
jgi:hypothetical protein